MVGPVRPSVRPSVGYACTRSRIVTDRILKFGMSMKIKKKYIFVLSIGFVIAELKPFSSSII